MSETTWAVIFTFVGTLIAAAGFFLGFATWLEHRGNRRREEIAEELQFASRLREIEEAFAHWFPDTGPEDLSSSPQPSVFNTLRQLNHKIGNLEQQLELAISISEESKSIAVQALEVAREAMGMATAMVTLQKEELRDAKTFREEQRE